MMSQLGLQRIAIPILFNISQVKATDQTVKFGQLIKYNKKNISLQKLCKKCEFIMLPSIFAKHKDY